MQRNAGRHGLRRGAGGGWRSLPAASRAAALVVVTAAAALLQLGALALAGVLALRASGLSHGLPRLWHRLCCRLLVIDVRRYGAPEPSAPVLYVCNHASYLDVPVLGGLLDARFIAKSEVAGWPVIGALCRLQRTIFIERRQRCARGQPDALRRALLSGSSLILFPEGTSSDGNRVLPFKSALFAAADARPGGLEIKVQPVTIAYSRHGGLPMGRRLRPIFAWYGDMTLVGHLWGCLGVGGAGIDVVFHDAVRLSEFGSRKALARHCRSVVAQGLSDALSGRLPVSGADPGGLRPRPGGFALPVWPGGAILETAREI
jgi:1-acyl-sn-glycerol-3-phosphate acyltransferase